MPPVMQIIHSELLKADAPAFSHAYCKQNASIDLCVCIDLRLAHKPSRPSLLLARRRLSTHRKTYVVRFLQYVARNQQPHSPALATANPRDRPEILPPHLRSFLLSLLPWPSLILSCWWHIFSRCAAPHLLSIPDAVVVAHEHHAQTTGSSGSPNRGRCARASRRTRGEGSGCELASMVVWFAGGRGAAARI